MGSLTVSSRECRGLKKGATVSVQVVPIISVVANAVPEGNGGSQILLCPGESVVLGGEMDNNGPVTYLWSPATGLDDPTSAHPIATPSQTIMYTLQVFSEGKCSSATSVVTVNTLRVDAGPDRLGGGRLGGNPTASGGQGPYSYQWSPASSLSDPTVANPSSYPSSSATFSVTVTDSTGCSIQSSPVNIIVRSPSDTGFVSFEFSDISDLNPLQAQQDAQETIAALLSIPTLAVEVSRLDTIGEYLFDTGVQITTSNYQTGEQLARQLISMFDCDPDFLPCTVDEM